MIIPISISRIVSCPLYPKSLNEPQANKIKVQKSADTTQCKPNLFLRVLTYHIQVYLCRYSSYIDFSHGNISQINAMFRTVLCIPCEKHTDDLHHHEYFGLSE